jgi:hypothetical protein
MIFEKFDEDKSGELEVMEVRQILTAVGVTIHAKHNDPGKNNTYHHFAELFHKADESQTGGVDFAEFMLLMGVLLEEDFGGIARVKPRKKRGHRRYAAHKEVSDQRRKSRQSVYAKPDAQRRSQRTSRLSVRKSRLGGPL